MSSGSSPKRTYNGDCALRSASQTPPRHGTDSTTALDLPARAPLATAPCWLPAHETRPRPAAPHSRLATAPPQPAHPPADSAQPEQRPPTDAATPAPAAPPPPASTMERYEPIKVLGEGAFGKVYLMRDRTARSLVCTKVIKIKVRLRGRDRNIRRVDASKPRRHRPAHTRSPPPAV